MTTTMALEQLEVTFCDVELGLDGEVLVFEDLAECGHDTVGADGNRDIAFDDGFAIFGVRDVVEVAHGDVVSEEGLDITVEIT